MCVCVCSRVLFTYLAYSELTAATVQSDVTFMFEVQKQNKTKKASQDYCLQIDELELKHQNLRALFKERCVETLFTHHYVI